MKTADRLEHPTASSRPGNILVLLLAGFLTLTALPASAQMMGENEPAMTLENVLGDMYAACLFASEGQSNPFSQALELATSAMAPGISGFVENNMASIPLTPPSLRPARVAGQRVNVVTGFTPIFTESVWTVGQGRFLVGSNYSWYNLSRIRGLDLDNIVFSFDQDNGTDRIDVEMPLSIEASVFSFYGTYGLTERFDIGFALPFVNMQFRNSGTWFHVIGDESGCSYNGGPNCNFVGTPESSEIRVSLNDTDDPDVAVGFGLPESSSYLGTLAVRAKYRFSEPGNAGQVAGVLDIRIPTRGEDNLLGSGDLGVRMTLIGEHQEMGAFKPFVNVGAQIWDGTNTSNLAIATGFTQELLPNKLFFAFDLLGKFDLESDPFLSPVDNDVDPDADDAAEASLQRSTIPMVGSERTLNAGLGFQFAASPRFQIYGSALFSLLNQGLQAPVAPTIGAAFHM